MKKRLFAGLVLILFAGLMFGGTTSYAKTTSDEIAQGVFVEDVDVSGMTKEEAKAEEWKMPELKMHLQKCCKKSIKICQQERKQMMNILLLVLI